MECKCIFTADHTDMDSNGNEWNDDAEKENRFTFFWRKLHLTEESTASLCVCWKVFAITQLPSVTRWSWRP